MYIGQAYPRVSDKTVMDAQKMFPGDPQAVVEEQIVVAMDTAGKRVFDRDQSAGRLPVFNSAENIVKRLAG
jgi:hypothetical protein